MQKMSTDLTQVKLSGPVMGTQWKAELILPSKTNPTTMQNALAQALAQVDTQMSTWKPDSDLMRLNNAPVGNWVNIPFELAQVLLHSLEIGAASEGAFDIGLGDLISAWGFGAHEPNEEAIRANIGRGRRPAHEILDLDIPGLRARKQAPLTIDLSGIAKGYGVDMMMQVCEKFNISSALVALDGELRSAGKQADGSLWSVVIEKPDYDDSLPLSMLELTDAAVASSGDYRHWVKISNSRFSHTMDRHKGGPVQPGIAAVTVLATDCMTADAMATAILVMGVKKGSAFAQKRGLDCLILERVSNEIKQHSVGRLFQS